MLEKVLILKTYDLYIHYQEPRSTSKNLPPERFSTSDNKYAIPLDRTQLCQLNLSLRR